LQVINMSDVNAHTDVCVKHLQTFDRTKPHYAHADVGDAV